MTEKQWPGKGLASDSAHRGLASQVVLVACIGKRQLQALRVYC